MPTRNSGTLIQSIIREVSFGNSSLTIRVIRDDLVTPSPDGGFAHIERADTRLGGSDMGWFDPPDPAQLWNDSVTSVPGDGIQGLSLIQSNFRPPSRQFPIQEPPGNLEVVANAGGNLVHYWRSEDTVLQREGNGYHFDTVLRWHGPSPLFPADMPSQLAGGVSGYPALIQGTYGSRGNFELVTALKDAPGIAHCWRNNDDADLPWQVSEVFATELGQVDAVTLIQSNYGTEYGYGVGNLEVIGCRGGGLFHYFRDDSGWVRNWGFEEQMYALSEASPLGYQFLGVPAFIQSRRGARGNFEVIAPLTSGGFLHLWRDNDSPDQTWRVKSIVGANMAPFEVVALSQDISVVDRQSLAYPPNPVNFNAVGWVANCAAHYFNLSSSGDWSDSLSSHKPPPISFVAPASFQVLYPRGYDYHSEEYNLTPQNYYDFEVVFSKPVNPTWLQNGTGVIIKLSDGTGRSFDWSEAMNDPRFYNFTLINIDSPDYAGRSPFPITFAVNAIADNQGEFLARSPNVEGVDPPNVLGGVIWVWWTTYR